MVISPTMRCNLNCYGCYAGSYDKGNDLPIEVMDRVLNEGKELGMFFAVISGGEPFIRDDVVKLFERHKDVAFQVYTHGGLLDEKMIGRIIKAGNILPAISLEGFEEDTDKRRGKGHYKKIMNAMRLLKENGVLFGFSSTQTRENADIIASDAFVDHMVDMGCTDRLVLHLRTDRAAAEPQSHAHPRTEGLSETLGAPRSKHQTHPRGRLLERRAGGRRLHCRRPQVSAHKRQR